MALSLCGFIKSGGIRRLYAHNTTNQSQEVGKFNLNNQMKLIDQLTKSKKVHEREAKNISTMEYDVKVTNEKIVTIERKLDFLINFIKQKFDD